LRGGAQGGRARLDPPGKRVWVEHQSDIRPAAPRSVAGRPFTLQRERLGRGLEKIPGRTAPQRRKAKPPCQPERSIRRGECTFRAAPDSDSYPRVAGVGRDPPPPGGYPRGAKRQREVEVRVGVGGILSAHPRSGHYRWLGLAADRDGSRRSDSAWHIGLPRGQRSVRVLAVCIL